MVRFCFRTVRHRNAHVPGYLRITAHQFSVAEFLMNSLPIPVAEQLCRRELQGVLPKSPPDTGGVGATSTKKPRSLL
jgi:hypothetical protein